MVPVTATFAGVKAGTKATLKVLTAPNGDSNNVLGASVSVVKTDAQTLTAASDGSFIFSLPDMSVGVLEVLGG